MDALSFDDRLEFLGVLLGGFVILGALGSLLGRPWAWNQETIAVVVQLVGIILTVAVGAALIWVVRLE